MNNQFKNKLILVINLLVIIILLFTGCSNNVAVSKNNSLLKISFIDVGQADSILIQYNNKNMLIDAGNNEDSDIIENYLKENNVKNIDKMILTHPHEDHIGGAAKIINDIPVGELYMPKVTTNTKTFENTVKVAKSKNLQAISPKSGDKLIMDNLEFMILAPNSSRYDSLNNYSIVLKLTFQKKKFIFMGDAEELSEKEILSKNYDVSADVIKIGHHGSNTSSSDNFINAISPKFAIISVGKNNDYHHPHKKVMDMLKNKNIKVFRTDENKTIILTCDGENINFNCSPGSYRGS